MKSTGSKGASSPASTERHPYAILASLPGWRRWTIASRLALLTISMGPLGYVLAGHAATGSYAAGGLMAGANAFGQGLGAPFQGRRLDRRETRSALTWTMVAAAAVFTLLAVAVAAHAGLPVLLAGGFITGAAVAGIPGGYRALLPELVAASDVEMALTVDAALVEVVWITGPPLVSLIVVLASATAALATMAVLAIAAAAMTLTLPRRAPQGAAVGFFLFSRSALPMYLVAMGMGLGFGGVDAGFAPLAKAVGAGPAAGGLLIAVLAISSGGCALVYGTRRPSAVSVRLVALGMVIWALLLSPFSVIPTLLFGVLLASVTGAPVAMLNAQLSLLLRDRLPAERQAEAFSIMWSSMTIGAGIGSTVASACISGLGVRSVFVVIPAMVVAMGGATALL